MAQRFLGYFALLIGAIVATTPPLCAAMNERISIDVHDTSLADVFHMIAFQTEENLVVGDSLDRDRVTLRLHNISLSEALSVLSQAYGLVIHSEHGTLIVQTLHTVRQRMDDEVQTDEHITTVRLRYARTRDAVKHLATFLSERSFTADDQQNAILLIGAGPKIARALAVLHSIDVKNPQVRFDVQVIDIAINDSSNIGTTLGGTLEAPGKTATAFQTAAIPLAATLNAFISHGRAKILASPSIVTANGSEASLLLGESYPLVSSVTTGNTTTQQVQYVDIGVKLRVTPTIGLDGSITAELHPEYSSFQASSLDGYPVIANRRVDSTLRVKSDETIVLAGLLQDIDTQTVARLPLLGDMPIFGGIFRNRQHLHHRDEIVFIITPHVR